MTDYRQPDITTFTVTGEVVSVEKSENSRGNTVCAFTLGMYFKPRTGDGEVKLISFTVSNYGEENKGMAKVVYNRLRNASHAIVNGRIDPFKYNDKWCIGYRANQVIGFGSNISGGGGVQERHSGEANQGNPNKVDDDELPF